MDGDASDKKWYQDSDDEQEIPPAPAPTPSHVSSLAAPGQTGLTGSRQRQPAPPPPDHSPKRNHTPQDGSGPSPRHTREDSSDHTFSGDHAHSRQPSDDVIVKSPVVPPKFRRQRSKSAGGIPRKPHPPPAPRVAEKLSSPRKADARRGGGVAGTSDVGQDGGVSSSVENTEPSSTSLDSYTSSSSPAASKTSKTSLTSSTGRGGGSGPLGHDYAVLEPKPEHDYAILDPEYHEEFYGKSPP